MDPLRASFNRSLGGTDPTSFNKYVDRLNYARPVDLTRQLEKRAEPEEAPDRIDLHAEADPAGLAHDLQEPVSDRDPSDGRQPTAHESSLSGLRESFQRFLNGGSGTSLLDNNLEGMLTPHHGMPAGLAPDTAAARPRPLQQPPTDGFVAPQSGGWLSKLGTGLMMAAPFMMMAAPMMMSPFGFSGFMNPMMMMMMPLLSSLGTGLMMSQAMSMPPPLAMPWMGMPGMGMPGMQMPGMPGPWTQEPPPGWMPQPPVQPSPGAFTPPPPGGPAAPPRQGPVVSPIGARSASTLSTGPPVTLSESRRARLDAMPPERREKFTALWDRYAGQNLVLPGQSETLSLDEHLGRLLDDGKLDVRDKRGNDLLTNLSWLSTDRLAAGVDSGLLTAQAIVQTADPGRTITQGDHGTCAATTIEYVLATRNPSEFVRVARGLTGDDGWVQLAGGKMATRVPDSVAEDHSGRTQLDRVVQAAFMQVGGADSGTYTNARDGFSEGPASSPANGWGGMNLQPGSFMARALGMPGNQTETGAVSQSGLMLEQVHGLAEQATGEKYTDIYDWRSTPGQVTSRIADFTKDGKDTIPVSLQWDGGRHRITVTKVENGRVYFRNPWGHREAGKRSEVLRGVDHQVGDDGIESIPVADFESRMAGVLVPDRLLR